MIDLSFRFSEKRLADEDDTKIIEGVSFLGEKGSATVRFEGKACYDII